MWRMRKLKDCTHVYAPAYYLGHLASLDPHEVIVVDLEDELLAAQKVIVALYSMIASKAFLFDS